MYSCNLNNQVYELDTTIYFTNEEIGNRGCISFLIMNNHNPSSWKNTNFLSQSFYGSGTQHTSAGLSAPGLTRLKSRWWLALSSSGGSSRESFPPRGPFLRLLTEFIPWVCTTEVPIVLLAGDQELSSGPWYTIFSLGPLTLHSAFYLLKEPSRGMSPLNFIPSNLGTILSLLRMCMVRFAPSK